MAWTLKDLKNFVEETTIEHDENEIIYLCTGNYFGALSDGEICLESDLED